MIGGFGFGFGSDGDDVRLFDAFGVLVDWAAYDDEDPWPEEPDGGGATLELINPAVPNFNYLNWRASSELSPHGTPGERNSVYVYSSNYVKRQPPDSWEILSLYPNPFNLSVNIVFSAPRAGEAEFSIFNILGRCVAKLSEDVPASGLWRLTWDGRGENRTPISSGIYLVRFENQYRPGMRKVLLVK